jgi:hypothetical protein
MSEKEGCHNPTFLKKQICKLKTFFNQIPRIPHTEKHGPKNRWRWLSVKSVINNAGLFQLQIKQEIMRFRLLPLYE